MTYTPLATLEPQITQRPQKVPNNNQPVVVHSSLAFGKSVLNTDMQKAKQLARTHLEILKNSTKKAWIITNEMYNTRCN